MPWELSTLEIAVLWSNGFLLWICMMLKRICRKMDD